MTIVIREGEYILAFHREFTSANVVEMRQVHEDSHRYMLTCHTIM